MACFTNTSVFESGLGTGPICSGRGECINNVCVCDSLWTGRSDYLDLDGIACQNPIILDRVIFALATVSWVHLGLQGIPIVMHQYQRFLDRRKNARGKSTLEVLAPFDTVLLTVCVAIPLMITSLILRQFGNFGSDAVTSFVYFFALAFTWGLATNGQQMMFESMLKGGLRGTSAKRINRMILVNKIGLWFATALYLLTLLISNIVTVFTPAGITPYRIAMVVLRNMGGAFYYIYQYGHSRTMIRFLTELMDSMAKAKDQGEVASGGAHGAVSKAVAHLRSTLKLQGLLVLIFCPILVVFSVIPQLFVYNYVVHGLLLVLSAGRNHTLHAWKKKDGTSSSSKGSSSNAEKTAAVGPTNAGTFTGGNTFSLVANTTMEEISPMSSGPAASSTI